MPVALLAGAFGQGNLGDEALLRAFVSALTEWDLVVTTRDPASTEALGCEPVLSTRPAAVARRAVGADAVVIAGGTVFKTLHPSSGRRPLALLASTAALVDAAAAARRPVAMVGGGVGRLDGRPARLLARSVVHHADLVILRDEESAATLTGAGVPGPLRVGADPAWTLLDASSRPARSGDRSVRVVPSRLAAGPDGPEAMIDRLVGGLARLSLRGVGVQLQAWQRMAGGDDDAEIVDEVARQLVRSGGCPPEVVPTPASLPDAVTSLSGTGAVLAYRYHALVAAGAAGVPSVAVVHEAKLAGLARRLQQGTVPADAVGADLAAAVSAALGGSGPEPGLVEQQVGRAAEGFRLLRVLLARGCSDEVDGIGALPLSPTPSITPLPHP